ncbi:hypothetical protein BJ085DRAFT_23148, partial [Dimargaris cristalligena]
SLTSLVSPTGALKRLRSPFVGTSAQRTACLQCGYTAAIRHFTFDSLSFHLPLQTRQSLLECLLTYTHLDTIDDFNCQRCSVSKTLAQLEEQILTESSAADARRLDRTGTKGRRQGVAKAHLAKLQKERDTLLRALAENNLEDASMEKIDLLRSGTSQRPTRCTKQIMFARPPPILCVHFSRSIFHPSGQTLKNDCHVDFPEILDLTPFVTGQLETQPRQPLTKARWVPSPSTTGPDAATSTFQYRLQAVLVHRGSHSSGHFITYRRARVDQASEQWFRISDETVDPVELPQVLAAGDAYMLFYERITPQDMHLRSV